MKIIFAGTPVFAAKHLEELLQSSHSVIAAYTQPDRPAGRGKKLSPSPVKLLALDHGLPVFQPISLKDESSQAVVTSLDADVMVVVAYGLILPKQVLHAPRLGCLNVHGSLLPQWRGAAPIQRAIENGDTVSGVTIMQMDEGLDTGAMLRKATCKIDARESSASLHDKLCAIGPHALLQTLDDLAEGNAVFEEQDNSHSSYARKIDKSEARLNWQLNNEVLDRQIRAFYPAPISFCYLNNQRVKVHIAIARATSDALKNTEPGCAIVTDKRLFVRCGSGVLELLKIQFPGKKPVAVGDWLNGLNHQNLPSTFQ